MKPTPQISPNEQASRNFPLTDYNFHATAETQTRSSATLSAEKPSAFHKLSSEFLGAVNGDHVIELLFFALITAISAWPIISVLHAITRMVRNY
jgi:hypothetical protein